MILFRYDADKRAQTLFRWQPWFAWYPCWIYESEGCQIAWVWLEWVDRKMGNDERWIRTTPGLYKNDEEGVVL